MTYAEALNLIALPCSLLVTAGFTWVCAHAAAYLRERTHNERLARVVDGAGRVAGDIADRLKALPAGSDFARVKDAAVIAGVTDLRTTFASTIATLGGTTNAEITRTITSALQDKLAGPTTIVAAIQPAGTGTLTPQGVQP